MSRWRWYPVLKRSDELCVAVSRCPQVRRWADSDDAAEVSSAGAYSDPERDQARSEPPVAQPIVIPHANSTHPISTTALCAAYTGSIHGPNINSGVNRR